MRYSHRCCSSRFGRKYQIKDDVLPYNDELPEHETDTDVSIDTIPKINVTSEKGYTVIRCINSDNKELCKKRIKEKPVQISQTSVEQGESNNEC